MYKKHITPQQLESELMDLKALANIKDADDNNITRVIDTIERITWITLHLMSPFNLSKEPKIHFQDIGFCDDCFNQGIAHNDNIPDGITLCETCLGRCRNPKTIRQHIQEEPTKSIGSLTMTVHTNTATLQRTINDLLASDELAKSSQTIDEYRDALASAIEKKFAETIEISEQIALMPRALTAENGAKSAMMASFHEVVEHSCQHCDEGEECELCNSTGTQLQKVPVSWTTIKEIYAKAVQVCEVKSIS